MGRELQRHYGFEPQVVMMTPLIEGLEGVKKMSKSLNNYVGINEPAEMMFGKLMSVSDELMWRYIDVLSFKTCAEIALMKKEVADGLNPRDVKINFAKEIVARFHDVTQAESVHRAFIERFQNKLVPDDLDVQNISYDKQSNISQLLKQVGLTQSTSESNRLIKQGAVKIDGEKIADPTLILAPNSTYVIQVGKRRLAKLYLQAVK